MTVVNAMHTFVGMLCISTALPFKHRCFMSLNMDTNPFCLQVQRMCAEMKTMFDEVNRQFDVS